MRRGPLPKGAGAVRCRYSRAEAEAIVRQATLDGRLSTARADPYTGRRYIQFDEVIVPAWVGFMGGAGGD
jgi:hypothetical protein